MAVVNIYRLVFVVLFCVFIGQTAASPTRKQLNLESSTLSYAGITNDGAVWDDSDEFDLEGDNWVRTPSPSPLPSQGEYEDYADDEEEDEEQQDAKDEEQEFLFVPPRDKILLQDDDDLTSSAIKVRHTGKNPYSESTEDLPDVSNDLKDDASNQQFEFTIDDNDGEEKDDDFILDDSNLKEDKRDEPQEDDLPKLQATNDDDDDDDSSDDSDDEEDTMFGSPDEDAQVIYGDHVFLY